MKRDKTKSHIDGATYPNKTTRAVCFVKLGQGHNKSTTRWRARSFAEQTMTGRKNRGASTLSNTNLHVRKVCNHEMPIAGEDSFDNLLTVSRKPVAHAQRMNPLCCESLSSKHSRHKPGVNSRSSMPALPRVAVKAGVTSRNLYKCCSA